MACTVEQFINQYSKAIMEGYAAVFAGAGLSRPSGYVNWRELIEPFAKDVKLDLDKEHDLIAVAQYYFNKVGNRGSVNQAILNEFTRDSRENNSVDILTRLPINTYWTTNYDHLIEDGLKKNNRKPDVKLSDKSLANNISDRDAVVYKMHGDVLQSNETVILKDDYESYSTKHQLFITSLQGDLISKTFLFIGLSFEDPNLNYILARIRVLLGTAVRNHFCFIAKVQKKSFKGEEIYQYNRAKQELMIKDLQRYGIQAVLLDDYNQIPCILRKVEEKCNLNNIFISGSSYKAPKGWNENNIIFFAHNLSKKLVSKNYRIISGFGLGIGSAIINGALEEIMQTKFKHIDEYLLLRPFPQFITGDDMTLAKEWTKYREDMIRQCGISIFMFGNKLCGSSIKMADGMIEEFEITRKTNKYVIPIGSTGGSSEKIFKYIKNNISKYSYLKEYISQLETEKEPEKLIKIVMKCIEDIINI